MYAEFATDPVVQCLAFDDQRHYVMILCLKSAGLLDKEFPSQEVRDGVLKRALGLGGAAYGEARDRLAAVGLVDEHWQPRTWDKRQFLSDADPTAAERQRRRRHGPVTDVSRVTHGPQIQSTDTEREKRGATRRAVRRCPEDFSPDLAFAEKEIPDIDAAKEAQRFKDFEFKTPRSDWAAAWRNWIRRCGDSGLYAKRQGGARDGLKFVN